MLTGGGDDDFKITNKSLEAAVAELAQLGDVDLSGDMAIVSLVGKQSKNMTGFGPLLLGTGGK